MTSPPQPVNLFADLAVPAAGERFETLLRRGRLEIERIVSSARPDVGLYDQKQDEWVVLLEGQAVLEVSGDRVPLTRGDALFLPAHTAHRVLETSEGALWLAVHLHPAQPDPALGEVP